MFSSIPMSRFALLASLFLAFTRAQTAYESIFTLDAFGLQQTCVQGCFTQGYSNIDCYTDVLGSMLGCRNTPCSSTFAAVDDCYCRGDLQTAAHNWLSSCIDQLCSVGNNSVNLATAASIYSGYCTARGFMALPASNTAKTSSQGGIAESTTASTQSGPTSASSTSSSNTTSPTPTSTLTIALACMSAVAAIAILAAATTCWMARRKKQPANPGPYTLGPLPISTDRLRPSPGSRFSDGADDITWNDSVSQVGPPAMMGASYPHYQEHSIISTSFRGGGPSTVGPGRNVPRY